MHFEYIWSHGKFSMSCILSANERQSQTDLQNIREQVGEEQFQTWLREKHGKKVAHRITESLDKEAAELKVAA